MDLYEDTINHPRMPIRLLFWLLYAVIFLFALRQILPLAGWVLNILQPFLVALILAYVFHPIVNFVQTKLRLGRVAGILVLVAVITLILAGLILWLAPVLYHQLISSFHDIRVTVGARIDEYIKKNYGTTDQAELTIRIKQFWTDLETSAKESFSVSGVLKPVAAGSMVALKNIGGGALAVVAAVGGLFFIVIIAFYFLADMGAIPKVIRKLLPEKHRERAWEIMLKSNDSVGGFLRGQLIACTIVGALASVLLFFVGLREYAILIGFFAGLFNFIPYLGPIVGATPAILWALMSTQLTTWNGRGLHVAYIVVGFIVIQAIDGLVSQPFIVGKRASLHPLFVMLALAVGAQGGIAGVILAVPVACIVKVLWMELFWKNRTEPRDLPKPETNV